jgi:hypothetical protein
MLDFIVVALYIYIYMLHIYFKTSRTCRIRGTLCLFWKKTRIVCYYRKRHSICLPSVQYKKTRKKTRMQIKQKITILHKLYIINNNYLVWCFFISLVRVVVCVPLQGNIFLILTSLPPFYQWRSNHIHKPIHLPHC